MYVSVTFWPTQRPIPTVSEIIGFGKDIYILSRFLYFDFLTTAFMFPLLRFWLSQCSKDNWINERRKKSTITPFQWKGSVLQALSEPLDSAPSHSDSFWALISIWDLLLQGGHSQWGFLVGSTSLRTATAIPPLWRRWRSLFSKPTGPKHFCLNSST